MISRRLRVLHACLALAIPLPALSFQVATDREGRMLHWPEPDEIRFVVHLPEDGSPRLPANEDLLDALGRAVATWGEVAGAAVRMDLDVAAAGDQRPKAGWDREDRAANVNAMLFETEEWRHQPGAYAVTLRTYSGRTGELLHTDIVFNAVQYRWAVLQRPARRDPGGGGPVDIQSVATHELGHALGFEHTRTSPSAMLARIGYGEIWMRRLSKTDREGLRFLYPSEAERMPELIVASGGGSEAEAALSSCEGANGLPSIPVVLVALAGLRVSHQARAWAASVRRGGPRASPTEERAATGRQDAN